MKILYIIPFFFSLSIFAQEQEYKYEPVSNKAEYYIGSFNKGKDLEDLIDWYEDFADWAEDQGDTYDSMTVAILTPYFNNDLSIYCSEVSETTEIDPKKINNVNILFI